MTMGSKKNKHLWKEPEDFRYILENDPQEEGEKIDFGDDIEVQDFDALRILIVDKRKR